MQVLKVVGTLKVDAQHTSYVFKAVRRGEAIHHRLIA